MHVDDDFFAATIVRPRWVDQWKNANDLGRLTCNRHGTCFNWRTGRSRKWLNRKRHTLGTAYLSHSSHWFLARPAALAYRKFNTEIFNNWSTQRGRTIASTTTILLLSNGSFLLLKCNFESHKQYGINHNIRSISNQTRYIHESRSALLGNLSIRDMGGGWV